MAKPEPKLSDMPPHIKQSITDDLDTGTKLSLREINKQFKEVVEKSAINYERLTLSLNCKRVEVVWQKTKKETVEQVFMPTEKGFVMISDTFPVKTGEGDYRKAAVVKMFSVFKNSKVSVGELTMTIDFYDYDRKKFAHNYEQQQIEADRAVVFEEIGRILPLKNFRLKIGTLDIFPLHKAELMSVLPYLEPGILKALCVNEDGYGGTNLTTTPAFDDQMIVDTDQWKQLKVVEIEALQLDIPFEKYSHIERVNLWLTARATGTMKAVLEKVLRTPTMKRCWLYCPAPDVFDMTDVDEYVDGFEYIWINGKLSNKHPYEEGKRVEIVMDDVVLGINKYDN